MTNNNNPFLIMLGILVIASMLICYILIDKLEKNMEWEYANLMREIECVNNYAYENFKSINYLLTNHAKAIKILSKNVPKNKPKRSRTLKKSK